MRQLTDAQQRAQRLADAGGRALVTMIDGRVAIILPPARDHEATAEQIAKVVRALEPVEL
ncbi:MAG TPA: hypothetical protein VI197_30150 [Polyangiaceae bacterium]